jgi:hypothetical protein
LSDSGSIHRVELDAPRSRTGTLLPVRYSFASRGSSDGSTVAAQAQHSSIINVAPSFPIG